MSSICRALNNFNRSSVFFVDDIAGWSGVIVLDTIFESNHDLATILGKLLISVEIQETSELLCRVKWALVKTMNILFVSSFNALPCHDSLSWHFILVDELRLIMPPFCHVSSLWHHCDFESRV